MKIVMVGANDCNQRLDKFLKKTFPAIPSSLIYSSIRKRRIKLNGKRCVHSDVLNLGDKLEIFLRDELLAPKEREFLPDCKLELDVVFEDENILVVNKPPGLVVHMDAAQSVNTLVQIVWNYLKRKGEYTPDTEKSFAPALCNRLDRNTGGLVIAAKNAEALRILNEKLKKREIKKNYICLASGIFDESSKTIKVYLKKISDNKVDVCSEPREGYKHIEMSYKVLKQINDMALLEINLITGRTHQIRAGLAYFGHPIVGDYKYGYKNREGACKKFKCQALCAFRLSFEFEGAVGKLDYLNKKEFRIENIWFLQSDGYPKLFRC